MKRDTMCIQAGWEPENGEPRVMPIYQSTTFKYSTSEEMGKLFDLEKEGYFIPVFRTPPVIWWRRKSVNWREGRLPC